VLFCGDSLKVDLGPSGEAVALSAHKAFHAQIPLSHGELREYRAGHRAARVRHRLHAVRGRHRHHDRARPAPGRPAAVGPAERRSGAGRGAGVTPAERYLASFPPGRVEEFAVRGLDELDVPLHSAAIPAGPDHPGGSGLGYGATPEAARTGALGEMAEMALSTRALAGLDRPLASYADLVRSRGRDRVQDPRTLCLEAGSAYDDDRPLQWLPMVRARDGEQVLVPASSSPPRPRTCPARRRRAAGSPPSSPTGRARPSPPRTPPRTRCSRCCSGTATPCRSARWTRASSSTSTA
jgi:hypothetical protein